GEISPGVPTKEDTQPWPAIIVESSNIPAEQESQVATSEEVPDTQENAASQISSAGASDVHASLSRADIRPASPTFTRNKLASSTPNHVSRRILLSIGGLWLVMMVIILSLFHSLWSASTTSSIPAPATLQTTPAP